MRFRFNVALTEQNYKDFNYFVSMQSHYGKKQMRNLRIWYSVVFLILLALNVAFGDFLKTPIISTIVYLLIFILLHTLLKPFFKLIMKSQLKSLKKQTKPLYSPISEFEFYDDGFTEITPDTKAEQKYSSVERISVVKGSAVYIHLNTIQGYILPDACFASSEQYKDFLEFIKTKCQSIDIY